MKNIVKYMMAAVVLTASFPVLAQNLPDGVYEEPVDEQGKSKGIAFKKSATLKEGTTDTYVIDLEAFVTGSVKVENKSIPADVVLVLDVSGSMSDNIYEYSYTAQSRDSYSYYDIYYYHDGYNENYPILYYKHSDDNYYPVLFGSYQSGYGYNARTYYYIYYTVGDTNYYLSGTTTTTTRPSGITNQNSTIWTGVLYLQTKTPKSTKIAALKDAVKKFIDEIKYNDEYDEKGERRKDAQGNDTYLGNQISIVKFASNSYAGGVQGYNSANAPLTEGNETYSSGYYTYNRTQVVKAFTSTKEGGATTLKNAVDQLNPGGATAADYGLNLARRLIENLPKEGEEGDRSGSTKTVVFFTDGSPTYGNTFETNVASQAIDNAYYIKNSGATVWTIGVFDDYTTEIDNFMNYTSSNYPGARSMSQPGNKTGSNFYQNASNANLSDIFQSIAEASGGSGNTEVSGGSTVTVDVVASSFSLPEGVTKDDITVTVAKCTGKQSKTWVNEDGETITKDYLTFGTPDVSTAFGLPAIEPSVDAKTNTVSTTGFDFSANWCGYNEDTKQYQGYKQIISFEIKVRPDAVGGPNVATNDSKSGIYVNGKQVAEFNRPHVKLPISIWIKKQGLLGEDSAVFNIRYAPYDKNVDPTQIPKNQWTSFTKVMISKDSPKDPKDGLPMEKLVGLDPDFFYRIDEDAWAWSYNYQDNGTQYTVGEDLVNPFLFKNKPKETVREAEATVRNEFAKKSSTTTTPTTD